MNKTLYAVMILYVGITATALWGCQKKDIQQPVSKRVNESLVFRRPETVDEKQLVANLQKITEVLKEIYKSKDVVKEVNAAIFAKIYSDESILLKDLLYPQPGRLQASQSFKDLAARWHFEPGGFSKAFFAQATKMGDSGLNSLLEALGRQGTGTRINAMSVENISLYFPFADENQEPVFENSGASITTLVTATADADEGIGYLTYYDGFGNQHYREVVVNDDYAYQNPSHIIGVNGIEPILSGPTTVSVFQPGGPIDIADLNRQVKQVYIGEVKCRQQYDRLISFTGNGGGSELRFTRADGFLKMTDGQVQADVFQTDAALKIERGDIRDGGEWIDLTAVWDNDWEPQNMEQNLAIYEEDNRNSATFNGSVKTTVKITDRITAEGSIGFTINYKSDDAIIFQMNYKHDVFFAMNRFDQEGEMRNGWPVRNRNGSVSFTFLDRTLY